MDPLNSESASRKEKPEFDFDISRKYPTDRGHFPETINDAALKREILMHGPCRPSGLMNIKIHQEILLATSVQGTTTSFQKILRSQEGGYVIQMR